MTLLWRSLALFVLFQLVALLVLWGERRGRGTHTTVLVLGFLALGSWFVGGADAGLLLGSAALAARLVVGAVRRGASVWRAAGLGLAPVLVATGIGIFGTQPQRGWDELERQMQELAGATSETPAPQAGPEERALLEQYRNLAQQATMWTMRLLPAEIVVFDLVQVLVIVVLAGRLLRDRAPRVAVLPVSGWRLPFGVVWALALGLLLVCTRREAAVLAGANVLLLAAAVLSLQGLAVLLAFFERNLATPARWAVLGLLVLTPLPFTAAGTAILGLADLWVDFRRRRPTADDS